jgi:glycosyltransferase involved in cell wall biosynthesis
MSLRIGLNLLHAHRGIGGGWQYIAGVVAALQAWDCDNEYIAYCTAASECLITNRTNFHIRHVRINEQSRISRIFYENTILQFLAERDRVDVMHWFANVNALVPATRSVVTVHDLLCLSDPSAYTFANRIYMRFMLARSMTTSSVLAPVSMATAQDLKRWFDVSTDRMCIVSAPIEESFKPMPAEDIVAFRAQHHLPDKFWLYVAHCYPHKNHFNLFNAYAQLKKQRSAAWPLVLRGKRHQMGSDLDALADRLGIRGDITWLPPLEDREMPLLYSAAGSMIFPSLFEGGGIPIKEALACGCPVLAADIPATREFAGDAAILFDGKNIDAMADALHAFEEDDNVRLACCRRGLERVERYRPKHISEQLVAAYKKAAEDKKRPVRPH